MGLHPGAAHVECFAAYLEILTKGEEGEGVGGAREAPQGVLAWKQLHWPHKFWKNEIIFNQHNLLYTVLE